MENKTLFDKIWDTHVVNEIEGGPSVLYIDRHLIHEVTSPQAFAGLDRRGLKVYRPRNTVATADHNVPTINQHLTIKDELSRTQVEKLTENAIAGDKAPYRKHIINQYKKDKLLLFSTLIKQEFEFIFWYTTLLDNIGHMDMGKPILSMMKHYLEINGLVGKVKKICPNSIIYVISDHGMERMEPKKSAWGMHSHHGFFSSNTGETIDKPYHFYELISKHKSD